MYLLKKSIFKKKTFKIYMQTRLFIKKTSSAWFVVGCQASFRCLFLSPGLVLILYKKQYCVFYVMQHGTRLRLN